MGILDAVRNTVLRNLPSAFLSLASLATEAKIVPIPPERATGAPEPLPIKADESYCRVRLAEAQIEKLDAAAKRGHLISVTTQFNYAGKAIRIPTVVALGPPRDGTSAIPPPETVPYLQNWELSPLFPYRGGPVGLTCGVYSIDSARFGSSIKLLQQLSKLLQTPRFPQMLDVAEVLSRGIGDLLHDADSRLELGWYQALSGDARPSARTNVALATMPFGASALRAGYIAVIGAKRSSDLLKSIDEKQLCVVDGRLRISRSTDFEHENEPLPAQGLNYLLVEVQGTDTRKEWDSLGPVTALARQAADVAERGDSQLSQVVLKSLMAEVYRSNDLTQPDRIRLIEAFRKLLETALARTGAPSSAIEAAKTVNAAAEESREIIAAKESLAARLPFSEPEAILMSIEFEDREPIRISMNGSLSLPFLRSNVKLDVKVSREARLADAAFAGDWVFNCGNQGARLYRDLLKTSGIFEGVYENARGRVGEADLHLRFVCPGDYLRVPFEYLVRDEDRREHFVLQHPLTRGVGGENAPVTSRKHPSVRFFNNLSLRHEKLSVLLIASNTRPELPHVDDEVNAIAETLEKSFAPKGIEVEITRMLTEEATREAATREFKKPYHIIHYAGHARYSEQSPGESGLLFWEKEKRTGEVLKLKAEELQRLLKPSNRLGFVFLSCCVGAAQGDPVKLQDNDFLGIADGILQAGVPSVLGYRWLAMDSGSARLATDFYQSLAEFGELDSALLAARQKQPRDDRSWISPILIVQS